jgi:undecaprenyl diphosphate synthase
MQLLRDYLDKEFKEIMENDVRIIFIGEREMLSKDIQQRMQHIECESANNQSLTLCIALSYGSRQEILFAARKALQLYAQNKLSVEELTIDKFSSLLYTADIPDPDILIRTSGEQRISNYLLWQLAYTELFFTDTLWPDFEKSELLEIIKKFSTRERRYGKS